MWSDDVPFLRYGAWQMKLLFLMLGYFSPFYPPNSPKNQYFGKIKKNTGDIIILKMCTKNYDQMMYGSWDMVCNRWTDGRTKKVIYRVPHLKNGIKKKYYSNKFLNCLLVGWSKFHKRDPSSIWKVISPTLGSIFLFIWKKKIFVDRIYQLRNFDTNVRGCHLSCLLNMT